MDKDDFKNYRPVTNLTFLSKILEKVVTKQLLEHINKYKLFDVLQSAHRECHSVESALVKIKTDIERALDKGLGTISIQLDGSAAFDTVEIPILLERLRSCIGVSSEALRWFESYLSDRT